MQDDDPTRLPVHVARELAVAANTDPRTVTAVYRDPSSAPRNAARSRAAVVLRAAGYIASAATRSAGNTL